VTNRISPPESSLAAQLDVVIVSFRCEALLRQCLRSLEANPPSRPMSVHVVDNASGDGTAEMVAREFPEVSLTRNTRNAGFAAANNLAIRQGDAAYVLVLNPDTMVTTGALDRLLSLIDSRPEIAVSGPRLELPDGNIDHAGKRSFPTPLGALGHFSGLGRRPDSPRALAQYTAPAVESGPVDAVNGAFMLIRREALEQVGGFDEGYWMYMEDLDLCYRFARAGWTTWYEPSVTVIHVKAGTTGPRRSARLNRAFHYGMYRFYRKHYARERNPLLNFAVYTGILLKTIGSLARNAALRMTAAARGPAR
jgi:N-acetylglucosaminyl-diphospho-decaprenol L-rhamnosyltransferase